MRLRHRLRALSVRDKILGGYLGILLIGAALGATVYVGIQRTLDADEQERTEQEELLAASLLVEKLVEMEAGARGFVITGRDEFLEPYRSASAPFEAALAELVDQE